MSKTEDIKGIVREVLEEEYGFKATDEEGQTWSIQKLSEYFGLTRRQALQVMALLMMSYSLGDAVRSVLVQDAQAQQTSGNNEGFIGAPSDPIKALYSTDVWVDGTFVDAREKEVNVQSKSDLPAPNNGIIQLEDETAYQINSNIDLGTDQIRLGQLTPIYGQHFFRDQIIYDGTGAAIIGTDNDCYLRRLIITAPNGAGIDISGQLSNRMMIYFVGWLGCQRAGNISGFQTQSVIKCYLDQFAGTASQRGLQFGGRTNKVFLAASPFYNIQSNGYAAELGPDLDTEYIDIKDNYFFYESTGAVGVTLDPNANLRDQGFFRGNVANSSIANTVENFGPGTLDWTFTDNANIKDSSVSGFQYVDNAGTITLAANSSYQKFPGTTLLDSTERTTQISDFVFDYIGVDPNTIEILGSFTVGTPDDAQLNLAIFKNGTRINRTTRNVDFTKSGGSVQNVSIYEVNKVVRNDEFEFRIQNAGNKSVDVDILGGQVVIGGL